MKRVFLAAVAAAVGMAALAIGATPALAAKVCVSVKPKCFSSLADAIAAAQPGDTIKLEKGTFAGGVVITTSMTIQGAGDGKSIINGGGDGPVIRIGEDFTPTQLMPTVTIKGVTITGGTNGSYPASINSIGGGILLPPGSDANGDQATGATLTIKDSTITGNRAVPDTNAPFGPPCPPSGDPCPFGRGMGGGIASYGNLTLENVVVSNNLVGGPTSSDADGGGILIGFGGSLVMKKSKVMNNAATVSAPAGRFAEGGGLLAQDQTPVTIKDSAFTGNLSHLDSTLPFSFIDEFGELQTIDMLANGGGMHLGDGGSATIDGVKIDANRAEAITPNAEAPVFDAGLCTCGNVTLSMKNSEINNNKVVNTVQSLADTGPTGPSAFEADGASTIDKVTVKGNTLVLTESGDGGAIGAVAFLPPPPPPGTPSVSMTNSEISGNTTTVNSSGFGSVFGGGLGNQGPATLTNDTIQGNVGTVNAPSGAAQGGGIWNGMFFSDGPSSSIAIQKTKATGNALNGGGGVARSGGGLYSCGFPFTLTNSQITGNTPDQIAACSGGPFAAAAVSLPASAGRHGDARAPSYKTR